MNKTSLALLVLIPGLAMAGFVLPDHTKFHSELNVPLQLTTTLTPTITPTPVPASLPTVTYEQMLTVEKSVLETTRSTLDFIVQVIMIALGVLTTGTFGIVFWANRAVERADKALVQVKDLEDKAQKLNSETTANIELAENVKASLEQNQRQLAELRNEASTWRFAFKRDVDTMRAWLLRSQVEEYANNLAGEDAKMRWAAKQGLIALTDPKRSSSVRRRSVEALVEYIATEEDPQITKRLEKIANEDPAPSIRRAAQKALDRQGNSAQATSKQSTNKQQSIVTL